MPSNTGKSGLLRAREISRVFSIPRPKATVVCQHDSPGGRVELVAPCTLEMTDRIQSFVMQLETKLPEAVREAVAQAFRELLNNAIEWGGKLDPGRKVRISCVRAKRLLLYRIADPGEASTSTESSTRRSPTRPTRRCSTPWSARSRESGRAGSG